MCYPKPGPRCSAHASAKLVIAKRNHKHAARNNIKEYGDYEETRKTLEETERQYDATPAGIKELQRRIRDYKSNARAKAEYKLRLERGVALRKAMLNAIKMEDDGDIRHPENLAKSLTYPLSQLPKKRTNRKTVEHFSPEVETMVEESTEWLNKLSPQEIEAVAWFSSNGAGAVNSYVITGSTKANWQRYSKNILERARRDMDSALSKFKRDEPVVVYRGISHPENGVRLSAKEILEKEFAIGSTFSSPAYMSTSLNPQTGAGFARTGILLEISTKKAAPIVNVSAWDVTEKEMIVPRNQKFLVKNVITKPAINGDKDAVDYIVQLEEMD